MKELSIEEKAKAYDEAIEIAKSKIKNDKDHVLYEDDIIEIFPELKENEDEDERIRKEIIEFVKSRLAGFPQCERFIAWVEKQGVERKQLYVRFGDIPLNEKSKIYRGEEEVGGESGVSVYPAFELNGNIVLGLTLPITKTTLYTQQHLLEYDNRPCYLVSGDYVGKGTDGEPLIRNISIIKRLDNYRIKELEKQGEHANFINKIQIGDKVTRNEDGVLVNLSQLKRIAKPAEEYNITGIGSKHAEGKLGEMIKNLKPVNEVFEQSHAWSEKDELKIKSIIALLKSPALCAMDGNKGIIDENIKYLKSLKERYTWKPSDEQIIELRHVISGCSYDIEPLVEIEEQLKKLREE